MDCVAFSKIPTVTMSQLNDNSFKICQSIVTAGGICCVKLNTNFPEGDRLQFARQYLSTDEIARANFTFPNQGLYGEPRIVGQMRAGYVSDDNWSKLGSCEATAKTMYSAGLGVLRKMMNYRHLLEEGYNSQPLNPFAEGIRTGGVLRNQGISYFSVNYYKGDGTDYSGIGQHKDQGYVTVIRPEAGLEALIHGAWQKIRPTASNEVLVFFGEMMEKVTKGEVPALIHRVQPILEGMERCSMTIFISGNPRKAVYTETGTPTKVQHKEAIETFFRGVEQRTEEELSSQKTGTHEEAFWELSKSAQRRLLRKRSGKRRPHSTKLNPLGTSKDKIAMVTSNSSSPVDSGEDRALTSSASSPSSSQVEPDLISPRLKRRAVPSAILGDENVDLC